MKKKKQQAQDDDSDVEDPGMQEDQNADAPSDDDTEYYRQEVGEEPDEGGCQILIFDGREGTFDWIQLIQTMLSTV